MWDRLLSPLWRRIGAAVVVTTLLGTHQSVAQIPGEVDLSAGKDNTLYEDIGGAISNGQGAQLFVGRVNSIGNGSKRRAVLQFDVSSIPAEATLTDVDLSLYMNTTIAAATDVAAHRLMRDWGEGASNAANNEGQGSPAAVGDATWVHTFYFSSLWSTPGGDYNASASATVSVASVAVYHWTGAGMMADVELFREHPDSNFGWIMIGREDTITTAKRFGSRQNILTVQRPVLHIEYTLPCPVVKTGDLSGDGHLTSADIIGLVNFIFKGGAAPPPCEATADVNCSGAVTSADIITMVNHVFKGGAAPCDVCTLIPGTWSCP